MQRCHGEPDSAKDREQCEKMATKNRRRDGRMLTKAMGDDFQMAGRVCGRSDGEMDIITFGLIREGGKFKSYGNGWNKHAAGVRKGGCGPAIREREWDDSLGP